MTIIKNPFEVFLVTSKKQGNGIIESKVGLYSTKASSHISSVQMKSWAGKALETVNCCAFLKRRFIGAC
jgi:hypothetical protein